MNKNIKIKLIAALTIAAFVVPGMTFAQTSTAPTIASLQAEIQSLLAEIQTLETQAGGKAGPGMPQPIVQGGGSGNGNGTSTIVNGGGGSAHGSAWCYQFSSNIGPGSTGPAVTALQTALQTQGLPVPVTGNYGSQTKSAVMNFQSQYAPQILAPSGLQTSTGYVGPSTRTQLNSLFGCGGKPPIISTSTPPNPTPCIIAPGSNIACPISHPEPPCVINSGSDLPCTTTSTPPCVATSGGTTACPPMPLNPNPSTSTAPIMCPGGGALNSTGQCPPLPIRGPLLPVGVSPTGTASGIEQYN